MTVMGADAQDASGEQKYPHPVNYRGWALAWIILGHAFWVLFGGFFAFLLITGKDQGQFNGNPVQIGTTAFVIVGALYAMWRLWLLRLPVVTLYANRIEARRWNGEIQTLEKSQIKGVKADGGDRYNTYIAIVPRQDDVKNIRLNTRLKDDWVLKAWLKDLHDLDAEALAADKSAIMADRRYGATEADRAANFSRAKSINFTVSIACGVLAGWMLFFPAFDLIHLAAAVVPILAGFALVRWSNGLIVWTNGGTARPSILACFAPFAVLGWKALFAAHLIKGQSAQITCIVVALGVAGLWYFQAPPKVRRAAIVFGAVAGLGAYGLLITANIALDSTKGAISAAWITDKYESGSRSRSYNLVVSAWSDQPGGAIRVPSSEYDHFKLGAPICIARHSGALGWGWFEVADCPSGVGPPKAEYPLAAQRAGKEGRVVVRCDVSEEKKLMNCRAISETPLGFGFGDAAVAKVSSPDFKPDPRTMIPNMPHQTVVVFHLAP